MDNILHLFDPLYKPSTLEAMRDWIKYPQYQSPELLIGFLEKDFLNPLNEWTAKEFKKAGRHNTATEAAGLFIKEIEDIIYSYKNQEEIYEYSIDEVDRRWKEFQIQMGWGGVLSEAEFIKGQRKKAKKPRTCRGLPPAEQENRNQKIIAHYERAKLSNSGLSIHGFAKKHHAKYDLGVKQVRKILTDAVGT